MVRRVTGQGPATNWRGLRWLGLTPEPERLLPALVCALDDRLEDGADDAVARERARVEAIVLHGSEADWSAYLDGVAALAERCAAAGAHPQATRTTAEIVLHHDRMLIGLPGGAYDAAAGRRDRLARLLARLEAVSP